MDEKKVKEKKHYDECNCHNHEQSHHNKDGHCENHKKDHHDKRDKELHKLKEKLHHLEEENEKLQEKVKYHQAELINYRKRKDEEVSNYYKYANQDLILEIIPVLDNFERAIKLDDSDLNDELSKFLDGFKMMYVHLCDILKRFGVTEIEALGKEFDPSLEDALMIGEDSDQPDNMVLEVLLKGYKLKDRVIRPASVRVNKINK